MKRTLAPSMNSFAREDIDPKNISSEELESFLAYDNTKNSTNLSSYLGPLSTIHYCEPNLRNGEMVIWTQKNMSEFISKRIDLVNDNQNERENNNDDNDDDDEEDEQSLYPTPIKTEDIKNAIDNEKNKQVDGYQSFKTSLSIFYLSIQFTYVFFSFIPIIIMYQFSVDNPYPYAKWMLNYQFWASICRLLFYVTGTISTIGTLDFFMNTLTSRKIALKKKNLRGRKSNDDDWDESNFDDGSNNENGGCYFFISLFTCLMVFSSFLITLYMSKVDTMISLQYFSGIEQFEGLSLSNSSIIIDLENPTYWAHAIVSDPFQTEEIDSFHSLALVRSFFAVIGWIGICILQFSNMQKTNRKLRGANRMSDSINAWRKRVGELQGKFLEGYDEKSLQKLISIQTIGLDRSKNYLEQIHGTNIEL